EGADQVDLDDGAVGLQVQGSLAGQDAARGGDAGTVDDDPQGAQLSGGGDGRADRLLVPHVGRGEVHPLTELGREVLTPPARQVDEDDTRALLQQPAGGRLTEPAGPSGDQCDGVLGDLHGDLSWWGTGGEYAAGWLSAAAGGRAPAAGSGWCPRRSG